MHVDEVFTHLTALRHTRFTHRVSGPGVFLTFVETETVDEYRELLDHSLRQCQHIHSTDSRPVIMAAEQDLPFWDSDLTFGHEESAVWVLLRLSVGDPHPILMDVRRVPGVATAHALVGPDDGIALSKVGGTSDLRRLMRGIQAVPGVSKTEFQLVIPTLVEESYVLLS